MLKFFFHRQGIMVAVVNFLAGLEAAVYVYHALWGDGFSGFGLPVLLLLLFWVLVNGMNWIPWYPGVKGKPGIRLHFQKSVVPAAYILFAGLTLNWLGIPRPLLWAFVFLFLPILYVNGLMLYFHFRDSSTMIPGYFSRPLHFQEKESP